MLVQMVLMRWFLTSNAPLEFHYDVVGSGLLAAAMRWAVRATSTAAGRRVRQLDQHLVQPGVAECMA